MRDFEAQIVADYKTKKREPFPGDQLQDVIRSMKMLASVEPLPVTHTDAAVLALVGANYDHQIHARGAATEKQVSEALTTAALLVWCAVEKIAALDERGGHLEHVITEIAQENERLKETIAELKRAKK